MVKNVLFFEVPGSASYADVNSVMNGLDISNATIGNLTADVISVSNVVVNGNVYQPLTLAGGETNLALSSNNQLSLTLNPTFNSITANAVDNPNVLDIGATSASVINLGSSSQTQTINIGTGLSSTQIFIGGPTDNVFVQGNLNFVTSNVITITNKDLTLNKNGPAGSGFSSGILVEEANIITGYVVTSGDRNSWLLKAPGSSFVTTLTPNANIVISQSSHNPVTLAGGETNLQLNNQQMSFTSTPSFGSTTINGVLTMNGNINANGAATFTPLNTNGGLSIQGGGWNYNVKNDNSGILSVYSGFNVTPSLTLNQIGDLNVAGSLTYGSLVVTDAQIQGPISGSKIGTGINGANISTNTVPDSAIIALTGSKVINPINGNNTNGINVSTINGNCIISNGLSAGGITSLVLKSRFGSSFSGDLIPRNVASINTFFDNNGAWGNETLTFNVGGSDDLYINPIERMRIKSDGNVGIATTTPLSRLHISQTVSTGTSILNSNISQFLLLRDTTAASEAGGVLAFGSGFPGPFFAGIKGRLTGGGGSTAGDLVFCTRTNEADTSATGKMIIKSNGNVGIGVGLNDPAYRLDVAGTVNTSAIRNNGYIKIFGSFSFDGSAFIFNNLSNTPGLTGSYDTVGGIFSIRYNGSWSANNVINIQPIAGTVARVARILTTTGVLEYNFVDFNNNVRLDSINYFDGWVVG